MGNNSIWNIKNEEREIKFLFDFFMGKREITRIYRSSECIAGDIKGITRTLDEIIETITKNDKCIELTHFYDELEHRNIDFNHKKTIEKAYTKNLMLDIFNSRCISNNYFSWIDQNDDRVCNFIYSYFLCSNFKNDQLECWQKITTNKNSVLNNNQSIVNNREIRSIHNRLKLTQPTNTNKDKIKYIICFLDLLEVNLRTKMDILDNIHCIWEERKNNNQMLEWFVHNEELIPWAWNYTVDNCLNKTIPHWASLTASTNKELIEAQKVTMLTLYDLLDDAYKQIFHDKIKSNGSQKKFRNKISNRKPSSIPLTDEHKEMLKKLADRENKTQYLIIEKLIEEAYEKIV